MPRPGLTQEQVIEAADALAAAGQSVTVHAVRTALGVGSFTTINHHLRRWREQNRIDHQPPPTDLPAELDTVANKAILSIWQTASSIARREVETIRHASHIQVVQARHDADEALQEVVQLEDQIDQLSQKTADDTLALNRLQMEVAQCRAEREACARRESELLAQVSELRADLITARTTIEQRIEECGILRGELGALKGTRTDRKSRSRGPEPAINS